MSAQSPEALLSNAVHSAVIHGWRVTERSPGRAVMVRRTPARWRVALCCLWWPGFLFGHHKAERRQIITVDEDGNTRIEKA